MKNEKIIIGDNIVLSVCNIKGNQVRIEIEAPKDVMVYREELYLKVKADKETVA